MHKKRKKKHTSKQKQKRQHFQAHKKHLRGRKFLQALKSIKTHTTKQNQKR